MNAISRSDSPLTLQDATMLFSKYWFSIVTSTIVCAVLFGYAAFHLPKKYKANFVLTIYSKYFQSPLIGDFVPELSLKLPEPSKRGQLIINLRAENAPETLAQTVRDSLHAVEESTPTLVAQLHHLEHFRPGRPMPTHRDQLPVTK